ncbi:MAG: hypothetical protein K8R19_11005, partial [Methanosarcinales archaeon]|nr:hypothetical protein [Methanosarcinales archaeon]
AQGMRSGLGVQLDHTIDEKDQRLSGQFTSGEAEDNVKQTISTENAVYSITTLSPDESAGDEPEVEHYDEEKDDPSMQTIFFNAFDVLLIVIITAILIANFRP